MLRTFELCGLALAATLGTGVAMASQLVVIQSRGASYTPGQVIADGQALDIPDGGSVTVIAPDGDSATLSGPYSAVPLIGRSDGKDRGVVDALSQMFKKRSSSTGSLGAVRAAGPNENDDTLPAPWVVSVHRNGPVCVKKGRRGVLWRRDGSTQASLELIELGGVFKGKAPFPAGHQTLKLPSRFKFKDGKRYRVKLDGVEATFTVVIIPASIDNDGARAAWMNAKGCAPQAVALLASIS